MRKRQTSPDTGFRICFLRMHRYLATLLSCLVAGTIFVGCEIEESAWQGREKGGGNVLRYDVNAPFTSLDPTKVEGSGSSHLFPLLYSFLAIPDSKGSLKPDLASRWQYEPKGFTWTFHLREDARFHDGRPVLAEDVRFSLEKVLRANRPSLLALIEHIGTVSGKALRVTLKKDDPLFLEKIWDMEIVPREGAGRTDPCERPIGSGPFKFKRREAERQVVLEANPAYYNGPPSIEAVVFSYEPDKEKTWTRLLSGETDIAQEIAPKNYQIMKRLENKFYFNLYTMPYYTILLYNTEDPLFADVRVRCALSKAIDRQYIVDKMLRGYGRVAVGPMGVDSAYRNPRVEAASYAPRQALDLLRKAGWSQDAAGRYLVKEGRPFVFTLLVFKESQIEKQVARYLQLAFNDIGITARVQELAFDEMKRRYFGSRDFQAALTELRGVYRDTETFAELWSSEPRTRSVAGCFTHPGVERLAERALRETDPRKQITVLQEADALIASLCPGAFLFHKTAIDVMSRRFHIPMPFALTHEGIHRLRKSSVR